MLVLQIVEGKYAVEISLKSIKNKYAVEKSLSRKSFIVFAKTFNHVNEFEAKET